MAQEIAQETFLRAFQALERFDLERPFSPWLYRIAANLSLKWRRRRRPEPLAAGHEGQRQQVGPTDLPSPEALVLAAERQARLWEAVAALPPDLRQVILLRHGEELSYREIASRLDIPLSSVKSRLFRARKRLRELLTEEMP